MNQLDKEAAIQQASAEAIKAVAATLKIEPTLASIKPALGYAMGLDVVTLYKISLQFGIEADQCFAHGAYFASCLLTAAGIEAFLTLMALQEEQAVSTTATYRGLKKPSKTYKDVVAEFTLDRLIKTSKELGWIPSHIVNQALLQAVTTDFPKFAETVYPKWTSHQVREKVDALAQDPGTEMLKVLQDMRNLVHAPRWLKHNSVLNEIEFEQNCKLAVLVGREIAQCISVRITQQFQTSLASLQSFESMPEQAKARVREMLLAGIEQMKEG